MSRPRRLARRLFLAAVTLAAFVAVALLLFLAPPIVHRLIDAAGSAVRLSVEPHVAYSLSDALVRDLLFSGDFGVLLGGEPLLSATERSHLVDVGALFRMLLSVGLGGVLLLALLYVRKRSWFFAALRDGALLLGVGAVFVAGAFTFAFDATFTAVHQLLFPAGTWAFNPATDRLVQLYPINFWVFASVAFSSTLILTALLGYRLARRRGR